MGHEKQAQRERKKPREGIREPQVRDNRRPTCVKYNVSFNTA